MLSARVSFVWIGMMQARSINASRRKGKIKNKRIKFVQSVHSTQELLSQPRCCLFKFDDKSCATSTLKVIKEVKNQ